MDNIRCRDCKYYQPIRPPMMSLVASRDQKDSKTQPGFKAIEFGLCRDAEQRATEKVPYAIVGIQAIMIAADIEHGCPVYEEYTNG